MHEYQYPFQVVSGEGLGISYSSQTQVSDILSYQSMGRANPSVYWNVHTGNMYVEDDLYCSTERGESFSLGYVYNAQAADGARTWTLNVRALVHVSSGSTDPFVLREADGHLTTYTYNTDQRRFVAPAHAEGSPYIVASADGGFDRFDPKTRETEHYNSAGQLLTNTDAAGRVITYSYTDGWLDHVTGPSGNLYQLVYADNTVTLYFQPFGGKIAQVREYFFDAKSRLAQTRIGYPDTYAITYVYDDAEHDALVSISQQDGTIMGLSYRVDASTAVCEAVTVGDPSVHVARFTTSTAAGLVQLVDPSGAIVGLKLDTAGHVLEVHRQTKEVTYGDAAVDVTKYAYTNGMVTEIMHPDASVDAFMYDAVLGLLLRHTAANGLITEPTYSEETALLSYTYERFLSPTGEEETRRTLYVYSETTDSSLLRFEISPLGTVTEHQYSPVGYPTRTVVYLKNQYAIASVPDGAVPSLADMEAWVSTQPVDEVALTHRHFDIYGNADLVKSYGTIATDGTGVEDDSMAQVLKRYAPSGLVQLSQVRQIGGAALETDATYNALNEKTYQQDGEGARTQMTFDDAAKTHAVVVPNGRTDSVSYNAAGWVTGSVQTAPAGAAAPAARSTGYTLDQLGRPVVVHQPDGQTAYRFYDRQNRLILAVSPMGTVTEHVYDAAKRTHQTIQYSTRMDASHIQPFPDLPPDATPVRAFVTGNAQPTTDRATTTIYDVRGQVRYSIDAVGALIETRWNQLGKRTATLAYDVQLTTAQVQALIAGAYTPMITDKTRQHRFFYDDAGQLLGEQDPAGYLIEYQRDPAGNIVEEIQYATKTALASTLMAARPAVSEKDSHTYHYYNAKQERIASVDAERYMTTMTRTGTGKLLAQYRYINKVPASVDLGFDHKLADALPPVSPQDRIKHFEYDGLDRLCHTHASDGTLVETDYDLMRELTATSHGDDPDVVPTDAVHRRSTRHAYDIWGEATATCPPLVCKLIDDIESDPSKTPAEKQAAIDAVWDTQSERSVYDAHGLKVSSTNPVGAKTLYYYDQDRHLVASIDDKGGVTTYTKNAFGESLSERRFYEAVPAATLSGLTGGFITAAVTTLFAGLEKDQDAVTHFTRNQQGKVVEKVDPSSYESTYAYNAFGELETERKPVTTKTPSLTVVRSYSLRGKLAKKTQTDGTGNTLEESFDYETPLAKLSRHTAANGGITSYEYDKRGHVVLTQDPLDFITAQAADALGRVSQVVYPNGLQLVTSFDQVARTVTSTFKDADDNVLRTTVTTHNAFGESLDYVDGLSQTTRYTRNSVGALLTETDPLGGEAAWSYDLSGLALTHTLKTLQLNKKERDSLGRIEHDILDAAGEALTTTNTWNPLSRIAQVSDPRGVVTTHTHDQRGLLLLANLDPNGLQITTSFTHDGTHTRVSTLQSNAAKDAAVYETYQQDGFGRNVGHVVDPARPGITSPLALTDIDTLDAMGDVKVHQDAAGNKTFHFRDVKRQERFVIDAEGGVVEHRYDGMGNRVRTIAYTHTVNMDDISASSTLAAVSALVAALPEDDNKVSYYFYDLLTHDARVPSASHAGKSACLERFVVNTLGAVSEHLYDAAGRHVATRLYDTKLDPTKLDGYTTNTVAAACAAIQSDKDKVSYFMMDAQGRDRFTIDAAGFVIEKRFDAEGNTLVEIAYVNAVSNPATIAALPVSEVDAHLTPDFELDRATFHGYDARHMPTFVVNGEGAVTTYQNNQNGFVEKVVEFKAAVTIPTDYNYETVKSAVSAMTPDPTVDSVTDKAYDNYNRLIAETDALGNTEHYSYLPVRSDMEKVRTDREGHAFTTMIDAAGRAYDGVSPPMQVASTAIDPTNPEDIDLTVHDDDIIHRKRALDGNGQVLSTDIYAEKAGQSREVQFTYDGCKRVKTKTIVGVVLDDPSKPASFAARPETGPVNLVTTYLRNGRGNVLVETMQVAGDTSTIKPTFKVYNAENQLMYQVDADGKVTESTYDTYGNLETKTVYSNQLTIDLTPYLSTGITAAIITAHLVPDAANDRSHTNAYDKKNNIIKETEKAVVCAIPNDKAAPVFATLVPTTLFQYNAFNDKVYMAKVVSGAVGASSVVLAEDILWLNRNGQVIAHCDKERYVVVNTYDIFGHKTDVVKYATQLTTMPTITTTFSALQAAIKTSPADKHKHMVRDLNGRVLKEQQLNCVFQTVTAAPGTPPSMANAAPVTRETGYGYDKVGNRISKTNPSGTVALYYYNAMAMKIADAGVKRLAANPDGTTSELHSLAYHQNSAHGETLATTKFAKGTATAEVGTVPTPVATDPKDQTSKWIYNVRGKKAAQQDPAGAPSGFTYSDHDALARRFWRVTNSKQTAPKTPTYRDVVHVDEERQTRNIMGFVVRKTYWRDGAVVADGDRDIERNTFQEITGEGPHGVTPLPNRKAYDTSGRAWFVTDSNGAPSIQYHDLTGATVVEIRSATHDLSTLSYGDIAALAETYDDYINYEFTQKVRDLRGRVTALAMPGFKIKAKDDPDGIIVTTAVERVGDKVFFSWEAIEETQAVLKEVILSPVDSPDHRFNLPPTVIGRRVQVDVTDLVTDVYDYKINYDYPQPAGSVQQPKTMYRVEGQTQIVTDKLEGSVRLVAVTQSDQKTVLLTGKTDDFGGGTVDVYAGDTKVSTLPVVAVSGTHTYTVDCSSIPSGTYHCLPTGAAADQASLAFNVYTAVAPTSPLCREINCEASLEVLDTHGAITWTVDEPLNDMPVDVTVVYVDADNLKHTETSTITRSTDLGTFYDHNWKKMVANIVFEAIPATVQTVAVKLHFGVERVQVMMGTPADPTRTTFLDGTLAHVSEPETGVLSNEVVDYSDMPPLIGLDEDEAVADAIIEGGAAGAGGAPETGGDSTPTHLVPPTTSVIKTMAMGSSTTIYVELLQAIADAAAVRYWNTANDRMATWVSLNYQSLNLGAGHIAFNASALPPGIYPIQVGSVGEDKSIHCFVARGGLLSMSAPIPAPAPVLVRPTIQRAYDAWNHVTQEIDQDGHITDKTYNSVGKVLTETKPETDVYPDNGGEPARVRPVHKHAYNADGFEIGQQNANGHVTALLRNAAGYQTAEIVGDGTARQTNRINVLGQVTGYLDSRSKTWTQTWTQLNQVMTIVSPEGGVRQYLYNEVKNRRMDQDPLQRQYRTNYDLFQQGSATFSPMGQMTAFTRNRLGQLLRETRYDGSARTYTRDDFGNELTKTDISGAVYTWTRDYKKQTKTLISVGGDHGSQIAFNTKLWRPTSTVATKPQSLRYTYVGGHLAALEDVSNQLLEQYWTGRAGRRTESILTDTSTNTIIQHLRSESDELGRLKWTFDSQAVMAVGYDAVGNQRFVSTQINYDTFTYSDPLSLFFGGHFDPAKVVATAHTGPVHKVWSTYDAAERCVVFQGGLSDGVIKVVAGQGMQLGYEGDFRSQEITMKSDGTQVTKSITWYDDGLVHQTTSSDGASTMRVWDLAAHLTGYQAPHASHQSTMTYNGNYDMVSTTQYDKDSNKSVVQYVSSGHDPFTAFTPGGQPFYQQVKGYKPDGSWQYTDTLTLTYVGFDGWMLKAMTGHRSDSAGTSGNYSMNKYYDSNGVLMAVTGASTNQGKDSINYYMVNSPEGRVLFKEDVTPGSGFFILGIRRFNANKHRVYYDMDGVPFAHASYTSVNECLRSPDAAGVLSTSGNTLPIALAGFFTNSPQNLKPSYDYAYLQPVGDNYPPSAPTSYPVVEGDTWQSVATKVYGNPGLATQLALKNGYTTQDSLYPGITLNCPPIVGKKNNAQTKKLYAAFFSKFMGNLYPYIDTPQPHESCMEELIEIVVVVIIAFVVPEILAEVAPALFAAGAATGAAAAAGAGAAAGAAVTADAAAIAIGAGVADIAQQLMTEEFLGLPEKIDWKDVVISVVEAGIGAKFANLPAVKQAQFMMKAVDYAAINFAEQTMEIAVGLKKNFSVKNMLANAVIQSTNAQIAKSALAANMLTLSASEAIVDTAIQDVASGQSPTLEQAVSGFLHDYLSMKLQALAQNTKQQGVRHVRYHQKAMAVNANAPNMPHGLRKTVSEQSPVDVGKHARPLPPSAKHAEAAADALRRQWMAGVAAQGRMRVNPRAAAADMHAQIHAAHASTATQVSNHALGEAVLKSMPHWMVLYLVDHPAVAQRMANDSAAAAKALNHSKVVNYARGFRDAAIDTVKGVWNAARHPENTYEGLKAAVTHPIETLHTAEHEIAADTHSAYGWGRLTVDVGGLFVGGSEAKGVARTAEIGLGRSKLLSKIGLYGTREMGTHLERADSMLARGVGYNISAEKDFTKYDEIGLHGTFLTDYKAIGKAIGPYRANLRYSAGLFSGKNKISYFRLARLEEHLGLERGTLMRGIRFTRVKDVMLRSPRSPIDMGNERFLGGGKGIPGGGPEIVVDSIPTKQWPNV